MRSPALRFRRLAPCFHVSISCFQRHSRVHISSFQFPLEPTLLSPEPTALSPELAVLSPEPAVLSPEPMALSPQSTPQSGLQPNPLSPSRETFIQSQYLRRRSNVAALYPTVPHPPPTTVNYGPGGQLHPLRDTRSPSPLAAGWLRRMAVFLRVHRLPRTPIRASVPQGAAGERQDLRCLTN